MKILQVRLLFVYTALLPFEKLWEIVFGEASIFKPYRMVGIVLALVWLTDVLASGRRIRIDSYDVRWAAIVVWGAVMSVVWFYVNGVRPGATIGYLPLICFALSTYFVTKNLGLNIVLVEGLFNTFTLSLMLSIVVGFFFGGVSGRFEGGYHNANATGLALALGILFILTRLLFDRRTMGLKKVIIFGVFLVVASGSLVLTASRAPLVALTAGLGTVAVLAARLGLNMVGRGPRMATIAGIVVVTGVLGLGAFLGQFDERRVGTRYTAESVQRFSGRGDIWRSAIKVGFEHYGLGVGIGQYMKYHRRSVTSLDHLIDNRVVQHDLATHSHFLDLFANFGVVALVLYITILLQLLRRSWRAAGLHRQSFLFATLLPMFVAISVIQVTHGTILNPTFYWLMALTMVALGIASAKRPGELRAGEPDVDSEREEPLAGTSGARAY